MGEEGDVVTHRATGLLVGLGLPAAGYYVFTHEQLFCLAFAVEEGCLGYATGTAVVLVALGALICVGAADAYRTGDTYV